MRFWIIYGRALRLRCPACGRGRLFTGWFQMPAACDCCGLRYEKAPGYFLGAIYINYGLTALLLMAGYFVGYFALGLDPRVLLWPLAVFCVVFPLWFFRYARALWLGFDELWDPHGDTSSADQRNVGWVERSEAQQQGGPLGRKE